MFRSGPKKQELLDQMDVEIEEHRRLSRLLRKEFLRLREEAAELLEDGLENAAKGRLRFALYCRGLREKKENLITNLQTARIQMAVQPEHPPHRTLENVGKILRQSRNDRERVETEFERIFTHIDLEMEETTAGMETFGVQSATIDDELMKLKQEKGLIPSTEKIEEEPERIELPQPPQRVEAQKPEKEKKEKIPED